ncbi:tyrosine-protein phosphatase [Pseudonocardia sp. ICBG1034]|uniref:tyrosine-protein phosphatase n=1 Tax=Pseudonocardia sp. ICBG1034 TaxID=2844381 RepID=UPI001CCDF9B8|nr:tyrosine-protein phosphatase [Pseudonocardia sp. ICBG1034]
MTTPPRGMDGVHNFRDLGGLRAGPDLRVRPGALFRSDTLQALSPADVDHLVSGLGLELVVDLRSGTEAVEEGRGPLALRPVGYLNAPLLDLPVSDLPAHEQSLSFSLEHLSSPASPLATVVRVVAALAGRPTLLHCAAGKDRTGLVTALLLRLLGVDDDEIVADYLRSGPNMVRIVERFRTWPRYRDHIDVVPPAVYEAREYTIRGFLAALDRDHGGAHGWARRRGIAASVPRQLRDGLLVPAGR